VNTFPPAPRRRGALLLSCMIPLLASACGSTPAAPPLPDMEALPVQKDLPDPLVMMDGSKVTTPAQWNAERRPELKRLFQHYMYGYFPPPPDAVTSRVDRTDPAALGGKATLKEITIAFGPPAAPKIRLLLVVPNKRTGPAPVILGLNFNGNHTVLADPAIALPEGWVPNGANAKNNRATEAGRGADAKGWAIENSIDRGYAIATFYHGDIDPDRNDFTDGIHPFYFKPGQTAPGPNDWGSIAAWAWGLSRAADTLVTDRDLDANRIAVYGHSRNGKTALLAGAFDDRFALVFPHQAGCGGSAPSRTQNPKAETTKRINKVFPHWFNNTFHRFDDQPERLPFDQHGLVAICAPRPVLFTNGILDQWANPAGQFDMLKAADPVYRLLGAGGLDATEMPPIGTPSMGTLGYCIREGSHTCNVDYWNVILDFADRHFKK
jgi:hypothetical protein